MTLSRTILDWIEKDAENERELVALRKKLEIAVEALIAIIATEDLGCGCDKVAREYLTKIESIMYVSTGEV